MSIQFLQSRGDEAPIAIPAMGLKLLVRLPPDKTGGTLSIIETTNAPGFGPPLHRHREAEIFHVLEGEYLYEVDGKRFRAREGDLMSIPGGAAHAFVNLTNKPARQSVIIAPGLDAAGFFTELAGVMQDGRPDTDTLNAFGRKWGVEFLGPPLMP
ncbi:cupin domain-containing protein [Microvirga pudoricolor]|uniref:cupin domain-containing protein n=1 Tax=Microvirga pudoricolor TaxID=2778729 RepID=UPI00194F1842|nr:cupin domain-containing protein [Microvirga pudoricolor]MBM6595217.1 cupin domain-containing protein [Microvirga pudoricolor]